MDGWRYVIEDILVFLKKEMNAILMLLFVFVVGTIGYGKIDGWQHSPIDYLYMTFITVSTIGYGEIVHIDTVEGRIFTIVISILGIGLFGYIFSKLTAYLFDRELHEKWKRRKMIENIKNLKDHAIVCEGFQGYTPYVIDELRKSKIPFVVIGENEKAVEKFISRFGEMYHLVDSCIEDEALLRANIRKAKYLFALSHDDNINLLASVSAKFLKPEIKIVARCKNHEFIRKCKHIGVDFAISPEYLGGKLLAYEAIRPTVAHFLEDMFEKKIIHEGIGFDEVIVTSKWHGKRLLDLPLRNLSQVLIIALKRKKETLYNPKREMKMQENDILIVSGSLEEIRKLKELMTS
ncbi:potassium channel family protein [Nitratiruptor sp. SB155-2]|uniref:potassium channel family protein n=1 Tax=Nitratiruptor sp. (strain SB155-2) TaxID=387092 RepID=UPI0001586F6A|nr:potassium channel protein [Nitratiruptor sp. SB155-2]BAF69289.1 potassium channel protein [Nitratiruptor sp. SB155-2]